MKAEILLIEKGENSKGNSIQQPKDLLKLFNEKKFEVFKIKVKKYMLKKNFF